MIKTFKSKALKDLWEKGKAGKIDAKLLTRITRRLRTLDGAEILTDLNIPGFDFHPLKGTKPLRYTIHINGPWCITFEWDGQNAILVDLEQYH